MEVFLVFNFSKSKYRYFCDCPKKAWLSQYKPEESIAADDALVRKEQSIEVRKAAKDYFPNAVDVTIYDGDKPDIAGMIRRTHEEIVKGTPVICGASFSYQGIYCEVSILKRDGDGWAVYDVKGSKLKFKKNIPQYNQADINVAAYEKYVLERCGINVTRSYIMFVSDNYVLNGEFDVKLFFDVNDVSENVAEKLPEIGEELVLAEKIMTDENEPESGVGTVCTGESSCNFWKYCTKSLPHPNVFDLYNCRKKSKLYQQGMISFESLEKESSLSEMQKRQVDFYLHDRGTYVNKKEISEFLKSITYPVYFLDFETVQPSVPKYQGTGAYAQIPFQYSLHYIESAGGELKHKEFFAEVGTDPRRNIAESLCRDIPANVCVTAYNKIFECGVIKELAGYFPDLSGHLLSIEKNIVDLITPFSKGWYYNREMGGSFSLKSVLPALFPNDTSLNYNNLEGIHNGSDAMLAFPTMEKMTDEEREKTRKNLLKYCELDTLALVKVLQTLQDAVK